MVLNIPSELVSQFSLFFSDAFKVTAECHANSLLFLHPTAKTNRQSTENIHIWLRIIQSIREILKMGVFTFRLQLNNLADTLVFIKKPNPTNSAKDKYK